MFFITSQVFFNTTTCNQIHIGYGLIIDQPVQFADLVYIPGNLIFNLRTVDGNHTAVCMKMIVGTTRFRDVNQNTLATTLNLIKWTLYTITIQKPS